MSQLAEFLGLIDWAAASFVVLIGAACACLYRMDRDPNTTFKMVQFISASDGTANSASLAYVGIFVVGSWLLFYLAIHDKDVDITFGAMMAGFVTGSIMRGRTAANSVKPPDP